MKNNAVTSFGTSAVEDIDFSPGTCSFTFSLLA